MIEERDKVNSPTYLSDMFEKGCYTCMGNILFFVGMLAIPVILIIIIIESGALQYLLEFQWT